MEPDQETQSKELQVYDITGDWGAYQWSLTLFAVMVSTLASITAVVGPIWTPEMSHICATNNGSSGLLMAQQVNFSSHPQECYLQQRTMMTDGMQTSECSNFIYDDQKFGLLLTNGFDLVCSRKWMRSFVSSSALIGMLLSSVSMGLLSDRFGRLSCIRLGIGISIVATLVASFAHNYFLLNLCFVLMSFSLVGAANALCTLVVESTSIKYRFVPMLEYGFGWGLGVVLTPIINDLTKNYQLFLVALFVWQLLLTLWFRWGVFESIRWLLSEGHINRAQIELQRACHMNRVDNGAQLANRIALVQKQQVRKASAVIQSKGAPARLAKAAKLDENQAGLELDQLASTLRRSFALDNCDCGLVEPPLSLSSAAIESASTETIEANLRALSPTLLRKSFSTCVDSSSPTASDDNSNPICANKREDSVISTKRLVELVLNCSKVVQEQEEGRFFLAQVFHRKLYKQTTILILISILLESSYFGFLQANKFVGDSVNLNYFVGGVGEWMANLLFMLILWAFSRRLALVLPTSVCALACLGMALAYQLAPDIYTDKVELTDAILETAMRDQVDSLVVNDNMTLAQESTDNLLHLTPSQLVALRHSINLFLMNIGKLATSVAIQVSATVAMEAFPNNLRQTGPAVVIFVGRIGSIIAPFLFNDHSPRKTMLKLTLVSLGTFGLIVSALVPLCIRNTKNKELCDRLNEIDDT